jgi:hypothetical protein
MNILNQDLILIHASTNLSKFNEILNLNNTFFSRCSLEDQAEYSSTTNNINFDDHKYNINKESETEDRSPVTSTEKTVPAFDSELELI